MPPRAGGLPRRTSRRGLLLAAIAAAAVVAAGTAAGVLLSNGGSGNGSVAGSYTSPESFTFKSPWRLKISNTGNAGNGPAGGCSLWLIDARPGTVVWHVADGLYGTSIFQVKYTGTFRWRVNSQLGCEVATLAGTDTTTLPFVYEQNQLGDTPVFATSTANVTVRVTDWGGNSSCDFSLHDPGHGATARLQDRA